jgi:soluble lytic murein transglycosylase
LLFSPSLNIEIGTWYLSRAMKTWRRYKHGTELALCQYNAGRSRAENWKPDSLDGEVLDRIKIKSTRAYVEVIMRKYRKYCKETENK